MLQVLVPSASALGRSRPFNIFSPTLPILPSLTNRASFRCSHKRLRLISHASKEGGDDIDPIDEPSKTDIQWSSGWLVPGMEQRVEGVISGTLNADDEMEDDVSILWVIEKSAGFQSEKTLPTLQLSSKYTF
ncbi:hypothetical protein SUGI_0336940 [Cryptomeria japonica]|nr:hypothetical protein SUGI_0336940 [Cryptomeria japonica]